jgi:hypothetical protein
MDVEKMKGEIISAGEQAVKELIKVAKESIIKKAGDKETLSEKEEALAADRLKNAAATKKMVARLYQLKEQDLQSQSLDKLYTTEPHLLSKRELSIKNGKRLWKYGYDKESDLVVISKTGQVGDIYNIQGLRIGLPLFNPKDKLIIVRSKKE